MMILYDKYELWDIEKKVRKILGPKKEFPPYVPETTEEIAARHKRATEKYYERIYGKTEFVNRKSKKLNDFIINDNIGPCDMHKLAELNGYKLIELDGWLPLMVEMIKELNQVGWSRELPFVKEKFGELRFGAVDTKWKQNRKMEKDAFDIMDKYLALSLVTCQRCGQPGELEILGGWWHQTRCAEHSDVDKAQKNGDTAT